MKDPKYEVGQTVYFQDDPEPGIVQEQEYVENDSQGSTYFYVVKFEGGPEDFPGFRYTETALFEEPTQTWASEY